MRFVLLTVVNLGCPEEALRNKRNVDEHKNLLVLLITLTLGVKCDLDMLIVIFLTYGK